MNTFSDTPTPTISSEAGGVSLKIEQGVLYENSYDERNKIEVEMKGIAKDINEPNLPLSSDHIINGMNDNCNLLDNTHNIFQPDFTLKTEPELDIDDRQPEEQAEVCKSVNILSNPDVLKTFPKIRPTPKSKLVASENGTSNNKRRYVCTYENCTKSYGKSSHLRSHLTWHTGIKPFVCKEPGCSKGFTRSDELNRHIRTHTGEKPFECVQCAKKFSRSDHLTKHLATHSKQLSAKTQFECKEPGCGKGFTRPDELNRHIRNHIEETTFECVQCAKKYSRSDHLTKHLATHSKKLSTNIPVIKKIKTENDSFSSIFKPFSTLPLEMSDDPNSQEMNLVENTEHNRDCLKTTCEEIVEIKQEIRESNNDFVVDNTNQVQDLKPGSSSLVQEALVGNDYNVVIKPEPELQLSETLEESNEPDDDAIMPEANLPPILQYPTSTPIVNAEDFCNLRDSLSVMADSVYDPTRPFPCSLCLKNFKRQDDLNRHMRTHTGEKPFACSECEKRFMRSDHLKKHARTHGKTR